MAYQSTTEDGRPYGAHVADGLVLAIRTDRERRATETTGFYKPRVTTTSLVANDASTDGQHTREMRCMHDGRREDCYGSAGVRREYDEHGGENGGSARRNDSVTEDIPAERIATSPRTGLMGTFLTVVRTGIDEGHDGRTDDDTRAEQTQR